MKEGKPVFYRDNSGHRQRCDRMYETSNRNVWFLQRNLQMPEIPYGLACRLTLLEVSIKENNSAEKSVGNREVAGSSGKRSISF